MAKKLSELTVDSPPVQIKQGEKKTYVNRTQAIFYSKSIEWMRNNVSDLIGAVNHYLSTYMNPKREPAKVGGFTDLRNKRMLKILKYLQEIEKKENKS